MDQLFLQIVNTSITASWLVLVIIAIRLIFRKAPKWTICLLWALVAIRLILPWSIETSFSMVPSRHTLQISETAEAPVVIQTGFKPVDEQLKSMRNESVSHPAVSYEEKYQTPFFSERYNPFGLIWRIGLLLMAAYALISYVLLRRKVATATKLAANIKRSEWIDTPFVLGILKPVVYLPYTLQEEDLDYVVAHELAHIKRKDYLWKPLGYTLLSVFWFNPLFWVAYILFCRDIEAACDEKVVRGMEDRDRKSYAKALLHCSIRRYYVTACPLAFGEAGVKERIMSVLNYKKPALRVIALSIAVCMITGACYLTDPVSEVDQPAETETVEVKMNEEAGAEAVIHFLTLLGTTNESGRYELITAEDADMETAVADFYATLAPYLSDQVLNKMMGNRMPFKYDQEYFDDPMEVQMVDTTVKKDASGVDAMYVYDFVMTTSNHTETLVYVGVAGVNAEGIITYFYSGESVQYPYSDEETIKAYVDDLLAPLSNKKAKQKPLTDKEKKKYAGADVKIVTEDYTYYLNSQDHFVTCIEASEDNVFRFEGTSSVDSNYADGVTDALFDRLLGDDVPEVLVCNVKDCVIKTVIEDMYNVSDDARGYLITKSEQTDRYYTGLSASFLVDLDGKLLNASFHKANSVDEEKLLDYDFCHKEALAYAESGQAMPEGMTEDRGDRLAYAEEDGVFYHFSFSDKDKDRSCTILVNAYTGEIADVIFSEEEAGRSGAAQTLDAFFGCFTTDF